MRHLVRVVLVLSVVLLAVRSVRADRIVYFKSGKAIVVSAVEERDGWLFLNFLGGGVLGVPAVTVRAVEKTDLAQEIDSSFGNTIKSPDVSRRPGRVANRPPTAGQVNSSRRGSPRQTMMQRGSLARQQQQQQQSNRNRPDGRTPSTQRQPGPYGLFPLNLPGQTPEGEDREKKK